MDDDDIKLIKSREINDVNNVPIEAIHLFKTNKECHQFNASIHSALAKKSPNEETGILSQAWDRVQGSYQFHILL